MAAQVSLTKLDEARYRRDAFDDFNAGLDQFHLGNAQAMMWISQLAYETDEPAKVERILERWELETIAVVEEPTASPLNLSIAPPLIVSRAVVAAGRGATIVAFAGTDPLEPGDLLTDIVLGRSEAIHEGFNAVADAAWTHVGQAIADAAGSRLFVTGHSLGSGIGTIAALRAVAGTEEEAPLLDAARVQLYGFGTPRALRREGAERYNATGLRQRTFRLVHGTDFVASVPPSGLNFRHVGRPHLCDSGDRFGSAVPPNMFDDVPDLGSQLLGGLGLLAAFRFEPPFLPQPELLDFFLATLIPPVRDHVPHAYLNALGTPIP
jgi:triacylglycerol lipase